MPDPNDSFQIRVISLIHSQERRQHTHSVLDPLTVDWSFLDAEDGRKLSSPPVEYKAAKVKRLLGFEMTPSEIGCFLSHKKAWQACVDSNKPTLVLEDDFQTGDHLLDSVESLLAFPDWDIARLQALAEVDFETLKKGAKFDIVRNFADPLGATAYLVKPDSARILIETASEIFEPLDHFIENQRYHGLRMVAVKPYPVRNRGVTTTIQDRPDRPSIRGWAKIQRSIFRIWDRWTNPRPWF